MGKKEVRSIRTGDMDAVYIINDEGQVSFCVVPAGSDGAVWDKGGADPLVQISCAGDNSVIGFAAGMTRHNSGLTMSMRYVSQEREVSGDDTV